MTKDFDPTAHRQTPQPEAPTRTPYPTAHMLPFDPARFHDLPEVEDVCTTAPGCLCLSVTTGEDLTAYPHEVTIYETPDGEACAVEVNGKAYRLPPALACVFHLAIVRPGYAPAVSSLRALHFRLSRLLEDPHGPHVRDLLRLMQEDVSQAARSWPGEEGTARHA